MASDKEFMNVFDASALLGVHDQTLRKLARQKRIPAFKVGKEWRFRREALVRWADAQRPVDTGATDICSVLIIDDDELFCDILARTVESFGYRARGATDGAAGLELVARETPDIILLDLVMPDMNGPQFLAKLRKTHPQLPVAIVTGHPDSELMIEAALHAPVMLLAKPVDPEALERTLHTVVGAKAALVSNGRSP